MSHPKTLVEATRVFSTPDKAHDYLVKLRWPEGVIGCPTCGSTDHYFLATQKRWKCKACKRQFSVKVGTIFEDSPITLDKWLIAVWLIVNAKNGISSCELSRSIGVTQKSAWHMNHRIRLALQEGSFILSGEVEADESYIGGKARNMHRNKRGKVGTGGSTGKAAVMGLLERGGKVILKPIGNPTRKVLQRHVLDYVHGHAKLFTDSHSGYDGLGFYFQHAVVNHAQEYVRGNVHTNGMENFWSLLKRTLGGTYVSVEPFHLFRYLDEQAFRYNRRKETDGDRFLAAASSVAGKRLMYRSLIGKDLGAI